MKGLDTDAMNSAMKKVISLCGVDVLADEKRFQAAIRDFLHGSVFAIEQQLLIFSVRIGIGIELLKAVNKTVSEQKRMLVVAEALLTAEYGFLKARSDDLLSVFVSALDWKGVDVSLPKSRKLLTPQVAELKPSGSSFAEEAVISFGQYKWRVLTMKGNTALLITDDITDIGMPYDMNENCDGVSWESCSLRKWLNDEFLKRFSEEQRSRILNCRAIPESNPCFHTDAGSQAEDKVFLLSVSEVIQNFGDSGHLKTRPENGWMHGGDGFSYTIDDKYNAARQAAYKGENTWWWLRSPGESKRKAAYVNADGIVFLNGELVFDDGGTSCVGVRPGVRPALWIQQ